MMNPPEPDNPHKRRPLWPWLVGALVLCLFAAGFSFWWPMYRANELIRTIREKGGDVEYMDPSSRWQKVFGDRMHPWFHEVNKIGLSGSTLVDTDLRELSSFRNLRFLAMDVSKNAPNAIRGLGKLQEITYLKLEAGGQSVPLDWVSNLRDPQIVQLRKLAMTQKDWEDLLTAQVCYLILYQCSIEAVPKSNTSLDFLDLQEVNLDAQHALAIQDISLGELRLINCPTSPEFWTNLSNHATLQYLKLIDMRIDKQVMQSLVGIRSLKDLRFENSHTAIISREQLQTLGGLKTLERLAFDGYVLPNDDSWVSIVQLPELKLLAIRNSPVGDDVIAQMANSSTLKWLILVNTNMTDEGLMKLVNLKSLKSVKLHQNGNTSEAYERFQTARPDLDFD